MDFTGFTELREDDGSGDTAMRGDRKGVADVVVEPVEDLHMSGVGQSPMSEAELTGPPLPWSWVHSTTTSTTIFSARKQLVSRSTSRPGSAVMAAADGTRLSDATFTITSCPDLVDSRRIGRSIPMPCTSPRRVLLGRE